MSLDKVFYNILLIIIPLYFLQGWLFDHGSLVSQTIAAIWLIIDLYYLIKYFNYGLIEPIGRVLFVFWMLQTITWLLTSIPANNGYNIGLKATYSIYKNISTVCLSYFPFYVLTCKNAIDDRKLKKFALLSFLCLVVAYFISYNEMTFDRVSTDIANRGAYYLVVIIPLLGLFFDNSVEFVFYGGIAVLVLIGAKRGAITCVLVEILLFVYFYIKRSLQRKSSIKFIWVLIAFGVISYVVMMIYSGNDYLQARYNQTITGDSSLRDEIYSLALSKFMGQDILHQFFGNGMSSTLGIIGGYAHQDWLELLINNGVLGVILYAVLFINLFSFFHKKRKVLSLMSKFMFLSATMGWFMRSLFSMGYVSIETTFFVIVFGYLCANQRKPNTMT